MTLTISTAAGIIGMTDRLGTHEVKRLPPQRSWIEHWRWAFDTETTVDDHVFGLVLISEVLKMLLEQKLEEVDSAWLVHPLSHRDELEG